LHKSRRRDALAWDFQRWEVLDADTGEVLAAGSLVDVYRHLDARVAMINTPDDVAERR
jgi:hypothetical protein